MARGRGQDPGPGLFDDPLDGAQPKKAKPTEQRGPGKAAGKRGRASAGRAAARPPAPKVEYAAYAEVALNRPVRREFTYGVEAALAAAIVPGVRVAVPFGRLREVGVVVGIQTTSDVDPARVRSVAKVLDKVPMVGAELLQLTRYLADRYACSWGEALAAVLPASLRGERGTRKVLKIALAPNVGAEALVELEAGSPKQYRLLRTLIEIGDEVEMRALLRKLGLSDSPARTLAKSGLVQIRAVEHESDPLASSDGERHRPDKLTADQQNAVDMIGLALEFGKHRTYLLQGVTGSGKTEVYLRAIETALAKGRSAIVLVPEIALTPQTVGWFRSRFGEVAILHSRMTDAQRLAMWLRAQRGEARVVVGARSAIFAPVPNLGVIVVDEEHEPSFKQESAPRYHARDLALERARLSDAVCILGSATPSMESWMEARSKRYAHLYLRTRVHGRPLPPVEIVDMRVEPSKEKGPPLFSAKLRDALRQTLAAKEQAIVFLNRRGFTRVLLCPSCRSTVHCESCSSHLTLHQRIQRMVCHLCCDEKPIPSTCPTCTFPGLISLSAGIERVERQLRDSFPEARVARMDSDTMHRFEDYASTLEAFGRGDLDILVGTQMIAKGLDFPGVTLVGIVSADTSLHLADLRASERTHQLIAQVAGRAGRGKEAGRIIVQTLLPENPAIQTAARHDFDAFAEVECRNREELGYPPYGRFIRLLFEDEDAARVESIATGIAESLQERFEPLGVDVTDAVEAPIALLRNRHRKHVLLKLPLDEALFVRVRDAIIEATVKVNRPRISIDVDPMSMM